ncbi:ABC transporter ATP-binding protein [Pararhodobacter sp. SW119]|uniref:ABC transporter ATP-binding protein n=1 Tax=Pararhodobacter sp. SW119 TaxID=2780075 RepID=UPI001AE0387C|nr:ABC transporter ATP-binding protein [Pararhodobacter sp. SW119]
MQPPPTPVPSPSSAPPPAPPPSAPVDPGPRPSDRVLMDWLWRGHVRQRLGFLLVAVVLMAIDGSMLGALSLMIEPLFDEVLVGGRGGLIGVVAAGIAGVFIIRGVTSLIHKTMIAWLSEKVMAELQQQLLAHLMRLDHGFFHRHPPGALIERVRGDSQAMGGLFTAVLPKLARDGISVVALLGAAIWIDWRWTLIALLGIPLLILPIMVLQRIVRRMGGDARISAADAATRLDEIFHGIFTIQRSGLERHEAGRFERVLSRFRKAQVRTVAGGAGMGSLADLVAAMGFALVLIYGGAQIAAGERTVGQFMAFFTAFALLIEPLRSLSALNGAWQTVLASLERVYGLLQIRPRIAQPTPPLAPLPTRSQTTVRFEGVEFAYDSEPVLRGFDLEARAGQTTALVGPSGAGKTTVFTLLTRLADPQAGRITIGGHDIARMDLRGLRDLFAVVAQDSALFDETLRDNVLMGATGVSDARLREVLDAAHVSEFAAQLREGLETRVGPRGSALSGGQRQRVAIARALLRDAPILLLDEATSALDARSESLVQEALDRLAEGRTTLVIAHRLTTVRRADKIVVMERGVAIEEGDHATLIARSGAYARLHALQFSGPEAGQPPPG